MFLLRLYISIYLLFDDKNVEQSLFYNHKLTSLRKMMRILAMYYGRLSPSYGNDDDP